MASEETFAAAAERIKAVTSLGTKEQLELYALYKQATAGDVSGARPGMLDVRGRAKYDAWANKKGMARDDASTAYVELVDALTKGR